MNSQLKALAVAAGVLFATAVAPATASAQPGPNVGQLVSGLVNVNVGAVNIGDITLVDVNNVLNNNNVQVLDNVLNRSPILSNNSNILTNLLRDAKLIDNNLVVVGVLSGGLFVIQTLP